jgi:hypothetical protein
LGRAGSSSNTTARGEVRGEFEELKPLGLKPPRVEAMKTYYREFVAQNNIVIRIPTSLEKLVYYPKKQRNPHAWLGNIKLYPLN